MEKPNLVPYETIIPATKGEPEAVDEVVRHYNKRIRYETGTVKERQNPQNAKNYQGVSTAYRAGSTYRTKQKQQLPMVMCYIRKLYHLSEN